MSEGNYFFKLNIESEFVDKQAEEDDEGKKEENEDDEDSENDDHVSNEYEKDDFIVDDSEEEIEPKPYEKEEEEEQPKKVRKLTKGRRNAQNTEEKPVEEPKIVEERPRKKKNEEIVLDEEDENLDTQRNDNSYDAIEIFGETCATYEKEEEDEGNLDKFKKLKEIYEPSILASKFLTEKDEQIRSLDIPERLQNHIREYNEEEIKEEVEWIYETLFAEHVESKKNTFENERKNSHKATIKQVLEYMLVQHLDIPFISHYRKEFIENIENDADLWKIYDLDEQWCQLNKKREEIKLLYKTKKIDDLYFTALNEAKTITDLNDLYEHFQLFHGQTKKVKNDRYSYFKSLEIYGFLKYFGLSSLQYADNLSLNYMKNHVEDFDREPEDCAHDFICKKIKTEEDVLKVTRFIMAYEISSEPVIRQKVRTAYELYALLSTTPTIKGQTCQIKQYRKLLTLEKVPIGNFKTQQGLIDYLTIIKAERDGFLKVKIEIQDSSLNEYFDINQCFTSDKLNQVAQNWNKQRNMVIQQVKNLLKNSMENHIKNMYIKDACNVVSKTCAKKIYEMVMTKPVENHPIKVLACCPGFEGEMTSFVMLDTDGEVLGQLQWEYLALEKFEEQKNKLRKFIETHQPDVIVIATCGENVMRLKTNINELTIDMQLKIMLVPHHISLIYEGSEIAKEEFQSFSKIIRRAISIGRYYQNPLAEISRLFNFENDILHYKFHFLQDMIPKDQLLNYLERELIKASCALRIDINKAIEHPHLNYLKFISGLGPRKARFIAQRLINIEGSSITRRKNLINEEIVGKVVNQNCIGFIKVMETFALDSTGIHPESYDLAVKMCCDALDVEDTKDDTKINNYVQKIMKKPKDLETLDLDAFADELVKRKLGKKHVTLKDIMKELYGSKDPRTPFKKYIKDELKIETTIEKKDLTIEEKNEMEKSVMELVYLITGESHETFKLQDIVTAVVTHVNKKGALCKLDNGLTGNIQVENISDEETFNAYDKLEEGMNIDCLVESIDPNDLKVNLIAKESVVKNKKNENEKPREYKRLRYPRPRIHPFFQNITHEEAEKILKDKKIGDTIFRPSSKGPDHIAMTFKFFDNVYVNLDITELEKKNMMSIGSKLILEKKAYDDLDEILSKYVVPLSTYITKLTSSHKFSSKSEEEIKNQLIREKSSSQHIPYLIGLSKYPGYFSIYYLPNKKVKNEKIGVSPEGYTFLKRLFKDPIKLINAFKRSHQEILSKKEDSVPKENW